MRYLFLSYAYPPMSYPRAVQVARMASHVTAPVDVVCGREDGPGDPTTGAARRGAIASVERVKTTPAGRIEAALLPRLLARGHLYPDVFRPWAAAAAQYLLRGPATGEGKVLVTFSQPASVHLAGLRVKRVLGLPWIASFSDPWLGNPYLNFGPLARKLNRRWEREVVEEADLLLFPALETAEAVVGGYDERLRSKVRILPHAYDRMRFSSLPPGRPEGKTTIRYIGSFYGNRSPKPLIQAVEEIAARNPEVMNNVQVECIGGHSGGRQGDGGSAPAEGRVRFLPPVSYERSLELMAESDALLVIDAPGASSPFLPSKLMDYLGAGKPIFGITPPGPAASLIGELGGWVASPDDEAAVRKGLRELLVYLAAPPAGPWGKESLRIRYDVECTAGSFESIAAEVGRG